MENNELSGYREFAEMLADEAAAIARQYFQQQLEVTHKADNTPVTQADEAIERKLRQLIDITYPQHGIWGEEAGKLRPEAELQWVIDPIDGTRAFIAGETTFCILIALVKGGQALLGVIDQPIRQERWVGLRGRQTEYNGISLQPLVVKSLSDSTIATTSKRYFDASQNKRYAALAQECKRHVDNSDAYAYAQLASGNVDIVLDVSLKPYDFMALVPVLEGSGACISDFEGKLVDICCSGSIIAAKNRDMLELVRKRMAG